MSKLVGIISDMQHDMLLCLLEHKIREKSIDTKCIILYYHNNKINRYKMVSRNLLN